MSTTGHTVRLVIEDGIGWVRRPDGSMESAKPSQYVDEVRLLIAERDHLRSTLESIEVETAHEDGLWFERLHRLAMQGLHGGPFAHSPDDQRAYDCDLCGKPGVCTKHIVHGAETMVCKKCRERNE